VETMEEAQSPAYRERLRKRVSAITRSIEASVDLLFAAFGTPTHSDSVYYALVDNLETLRQEGIVKYERIDLPYEAVEGDILGRKPGEILCEERAVKARIHKAIMDPAEYAAAYGLTQVGGNKWEKSDLEVLKDWSIPWVENEKHFYNILFQSYMENRPDNIRRDSWTHTVKSILLKLSFAVGWDPATTGVNAIGLLAFLGARFWILRVHLGQCDSMEQVAIAQSFWEDFPSAEVVIESNAQQKTFIDIFEQACPDAEVVAHNTFHENKKSSRVGLPAMLRFMRRGMCKLPFASEDVCHDYFQPLFKELLRHGPTAHPHLLPALWFAWMNNRNQMVEDDIAAVIDQKDEEKKKEIESVRIIRPKPTVRLSPTSQIIRKSSQAAWSRRHR
jgi:hypothetical protein